MTSERRLSYNGESNVIREVKQSDFSTLSPLIITSVEISIHTILNIRQVYPQFTFERKQKWGAIVYKSRVPAVQSYITSLVESVIEQIKQDKVENIIVIIKNKYDIPFEKFIFRIDKRIDDIEDHLKDTSFQDALAHDQVGVYARSILVRLSTLDAMLEPLKEEEDLTFSVQLELRQSSEMNNSSEWITRNNNHTKDSQDIIPVRAIDTGILNLQLLCQETEYK
ncbi:DNA-binding protein [Wallemia mellicola]|uniref:DNA-binding protein n=1 Tax=Wallemia mellicola TaxID=1708541 RepID=A0A4T0SPV3_9BASI|nr:hypothetical protein E3Q24_00228 [Wallemia mellicola]TIB89136.1 DNA-binding protein [Wallemia mellicola]TIB91717.1 DNA-binding protein [Wallemia mellicola]TIC03916.1 DNA-binding protein [Wallemia mellicola]TIC06912.1 DNA-binding protein [Wallemia mellicola]